MKIAGLRALVVGVLLQACATSDSSHLASGENSNRKNFRRWVERGMFEKAAAFEFLVKEDEEAEFEVLAQYYLSTCQFQKSLSAARKISDSTTRTLFLAVMASLISVPRPLQKVKNTQLNQPSVPEGQIRYRFDDSEVWRDEWANVKFHPEPCQRFPMIANLDRREEVRGFAQKMFQALPVNLVAKNFHTLALAMDVGYRSSLSAQVLEQFRPFQNDSYYSQIQDLVSEEEKAKTFETLQTRIDKAKAEIEMTELNLDSTEFKSHEVVVPQLLNVGAES